jgi:hypothetical protein
VYEDMVVKFLEQFVLITDALADSGLYDPQDGFFYDRLIGPDDAATPIRVQTLVGVIPALPAVSIPERNSERVQRLGKRFARRVDRRPDATDQSWRIRGTGTSRRLLVSVLTEDQLRTVLATLFDEDAFLSRHGLRSLSKRFEAPYTLPGMPDAVIDYQPAESRTSMYGGNSNWRGPVWFPVNYLVIRALLQYAAFFEDDFTVEYPTGSGRRRTLPGVAGDLADRLVGIWLPGPDGARPVAGGVEQLRNDPAWKDNLLFNEYFHGDNGAGLGAMHQTGWTALVADLILDPPGRSTRILGHEAPADPELI